MTWVYGDRTADEVKLRLSSESNGDTTVELEHASVTRMVEVGGRLVDVILNDHETGIWGLGTGWELGLIGLGRFLLGEMPGESAAESFDESSPELQQLADRCGRGWAAVVEAAGPPV